MSANGKNAMLLNADIGRMERETEMLMATVLSLAEDELRAPSKVEGLSRGHIVALLAHEADALVNLVTWATTGNETPAYPSVEERNAQIDKDAQLPAAELKDRLVAANARLAEAIVTLKDGIVTETVQDGGGRELSAVAIPARRTTDVIIRHDDLDTTWEWHEADPEAIADAVEACVRLIQSKDDSPGVTITTGEGDEWVIGDGSFKISGYRDEILPYVARGQVEEGLEFEGELPTLAQWGE